MSGVNELSRSVEEFFQMIPSVQSPIFSQFKLGELRDKKQLSAYDWAKKLGVYLFFHKGQIRYIGRALSTTLANRIFDQVRSIGNPVWDAVIQDDNTIIAVVPLNSENAYWAASLEAFLITEYRALLVNKRSS